MRVGFGKLGRSILLDGGRWGPVGGDHEPYNSLVHLAKRWPDVTWVLLGRRSKCTLPLPPNVELPPMPPMPLKEKIPGRRGDRIGLQVWTEHTEALAAPYEGLDGVVLWLGQHGTTCTPVPTVRDAVLSDEQRAIQELRGFPTHDERGRQLTMPQEWSMLYASAHVVGINRWRAVDPLAREPIWLLSDNRNYLKSRDLKDPHRRAALSQHEFSVNLKHWRYDDPRSPQDCGFRDVARPAKEPGLWQEKLRHEYAGLQICTRPLHDPSLWTWERPFEERVDFGMITNEARAYVSLNRCDMMREWVMPLEPAFIRGKWSEQGAEDLGISPTHCHFSEVPSIFSEAKCTFTMPVPDSTSGRGWATPKAHEAFRAGTICFFHPSYDSQGWIIPTLEQVERGEVEDRPQCSADVLAYLARWLRVRTPGELRSRVAAVASSRETYEWLRNAQLARDGAMIAEDVFIRKIGERLGI